MEDKLKNIIIAIQPEFESEDDLREKLEMGKVYPFKITLFDPKEHKMALSYVGEEKKEEK